MSHKTSSKKEQKKLLAQIFFEEIQGMVCVAFSRYDTEAVMAKVAEYGRAKYNEDR